MFISSAVCSTKGTLEILMSFEVVVVGTPGCCLNSSVKTTLHSKMTLRSFLVHIAYWKLLEVVGHFLKLTIFVSVMNWKKNIEQLDICTFYLYLLPYIYK